jgi:hypothetical protein
MDLYIHSHIRLHGVVLNLLGTGTTLPFITRRTWEFKSPQFEYELPGMKVFEVFLTSSSRMLKWLESCLTQEVIYFSVPHVIA